MTPDMAVDVPLDVPLGIDRAFWFGRRVLVTGDTGFKGAWMCMLLRRLGAVPHGFALPATAPSLHGLASVAGDAPPFIGDLRDPSAVAAGVAAASPDIVFHFAAKALVREAYAAPALTFATNVVGTANLLDAIRAAACPPSAVLVATTDKVYANSGDTQPFPETAPLGAVEPYGASKAGQEMVVDAYRASYFASSPTRIVTARAGNVLGGGDFATDRLVPDLVRAAARGEQAVLRNPASVRPWQHVLDCLAGYLRYAQAAGARQVGLPSRLNFGPSGTGPLGTGIAVQDVAEAICAALGRTGWRVHSDPTAPREAPALRLESRLARETLNWTETWPGQLGLAATADWYKAWLNGQDMREVSLTQIDAFLGSPP